MSWGLEIYYIPKFDNVSINDALYCYHRAHFEWCKANETWYQNQGKDMTFAEYDSGYKDYKEPDIKTIDKYCVWYNDLKNKGCTYGITDSDYLLADWCSSGRVIDDAVSSIFSEVTVNKDSYSYRYIDSIKQIDELEQFYKEWEEQYKLVPVTVNNAYQNEYTEEYDIKKITLIPINGIEAIFENGTSRRIETRYDDYYDEPTTELYASIKPISSDQRYDWEKLGRAIRRMRSIDLKNFYIIYSRG